MNKDDNRYFSDEELKTMIQAVAHGQESFTEEDVDKVYDWALKTRLDVAFLELVLSGKLAINTQGKEFIFSERR
jgi:hypothetical protein